MGNLCCKDRPKGIQSPTPPPTESNDSDPCSQQFYDPQFDQATTKADCIRTTVSRCGHTVDHKIKRHSLNEVKINELFDKYRSAEEDIIDAEGVCRLCEDLNMEADDFRILLLAWKCQAEQMCQFSRAEFSRGMMALNSDSLPSLIRSLQELSSQMKPLSCSEFHSIYKWAFTFALEEETQRTLSVESASQLWKVVFSPDEPPILDFWLEFLEGISDSIPGVSRDTWNLFLIFVRRCAHDLSTYDEQEAWPSLIDDFVHHHNDQTNQNCSKAPWNASGSSNVISSP